MVLIYNDEKLRLRGMVHRNAVFHYSLSLYELI